MLFRRISKHVNDQNWFAVGIDFFIVVFGVFIGLQVSNWNERLDDRQRAENYIERLTTEMTINRQMLASRLESYDQQIAYGLSAIDASVEPTNDEAAWAVIRSFFQASHAFTITLQRGTYDEIISSGDLALLGDQELVNTLSGFYTFGGFSTIDIIPDYRENVRRLIPFQLQNYFQTKCYQIILPDIHNLLNCAPPGEFDGFRELATRLQSNQELKRDLQYMISHSGVSKNIAQNRMNRADNVLAILSKKTNSN